MCSRLCSSCALDPPPPLRVSPRALPGAPALRKSCRWRRRNPSGARRARGVAAGAHSGDNSLAANSNNTLPNGRRILFCDRTSPLHPEFQCWAATWICSLGHSPAHLFNIEIWGKGLWESQNIFRLRYSGRAVALGERTTSVKEWSGG